MFDDWYNTTSGCYNSHEVPTMAMDDVYRLVQAVLIDGRIFLPTRWDGTLPEGPWKEAEVLDAAVVGNLRSGSFNGYVRYVVDGESLAKDATFHQLWMEGWTTRGVRDAVEDAKKAQRRKPPKPLDMLYIVRHADGREDINRGPLSAEDHAFLKGRGKYREDKYRRVR